MIMEKGVLTVGLNLSDLSASACDCKGNGECIDSVSLHGYFSQDLVKVVRLHTLRVPKKIWVFAGKRPPLIVARVSMSSDLNDLTSLFLPMSSAVFVAWALVNPIQQRHCSRIGSPSRIT